MNDQLKNGQCRVCGETFLSMEKDEYKSVVSRHILDEHRDQPIDKPLVISMEEDEIDDC